MKINKKIIVSSMALCMGAALAGSVSGTIAWYQYSTRSTVAMLGASVGVNRNLQVKVGDGSWKSDLKIQDITTYLASAANTGSKGDLYPVTAGASAKDEELGTLYRNPLYQHADMSTWDVAKATDYVTLPLHIRAVESKDNQESNNKYIQKKIYLHNVTIIDSTESTVDGKVADAVRVSVEGDTKFANISAKGEDVDTFGKLDLNGDGAKDTVNHYEFETTKTEIVYGGSGVEKTYKAGEAADEADLYANDDANGAITSGLVLGETAADDENGLAVTVKIWLQGWQKLGADEAVLWDVEDYNNAKFNVGITFTCPRD